MTTTALRVAGPAAFLFTTTLLVEDRVVEGQSVKEPYGTIVVIVWVLSAVFLVLSFESVRRRIPLQWTGFGNPISVTFEYIRDMWLVVGVKNRGKTIPEADITLMIPRNMFRILLYEPTAGKDSTKGHMEITFEPVCDGAGDSTYWVEPEVRLSGGGNTTQMPYRTHGVPGEYPLLLKVYADEIGSLELPDTFVIPYTDQHRERDERSRETTRTTLARVSEELLWNKNKLVKAMGEGHYWPSTENAIHNLSTNYPYPIRGAPDGTRLYLEIEEAYEAATRIGTLVVFRQSDSPSIEETDEIERAVVSTLWARLSVERALRQIEAGQWD